jgi:hypothetical protein
MAMFRPLRKAAVRSLQLLLEIKHRNGLPQHGGRFAIAVGADIDIAVGVGSQRCCSA